MAIVVYTDIDICVHCLYTQILRRKHDTVNTGQRDMGVLEYWPRNLHAMHNLSDDYLKNANSKK